MRRRFGMFQEYVPRWRGSHGSPPCLLPGNLVTHDVAWVVEDRGVSLDAGEGGEFE